MQQEVKEILAMDRQHINDESISGRKYFHTLLNMADDDLSPYQYRLYGHYVRVAGEHGACYESVRTTARITQMSPAMVVKTRNELTVLRFIECVKSDDPNETIAITVVDRWSENITRYSSPHKQVVHQVNTGVHSINTGVHLVSLKKNYKKKNTEEELSTPALQDAPATPSDIAISLTNGSAARSTVEAAPGFKEESSAGAATKPRTPRQQAHDEATRQKIAPLESAWGVSASTPDIPLYLKVTNALLNGGVLADEFPLYVERLRKKARQGRWTLTLNALITGGRISEYVGARNAYQWQQAEAAVMKPLEYYEDEDDL